MKNKSRIAIIVVTGLLTFGTLFVVKAKKRRHHKKQGMEQNDQCHKKDAKAHHFKKHAEKPAE